VLKALGQSRTGDKPCMTLPLFESYREIPLTREQVTLVDVADYEWLTQWTWTAEWSDHTKSFYAVRKHTGEDGKTQRIAMHNEILGISMPLRGDHISHDTLDNRRYNLRISTNSQNCQNRRRRTDNTSGYKGVSWFKKNSKWGVQIYVNRKNVFIGLFPEDQIIEAALAYDKAALEHFGEFALTNFSH
jgi:hypothetical protein